MYHKINRSVDRSQKYLLCNIFLGTKVTNQCVVVYRDKNRIFGEVPAIVLSAKQGPIEYLHVNSFCVVCSDPPFGCCHLTEFCFSILRKRPVCTRRLISHIRIEWHESVATQI